MRPDEENEVSTDAVTLKWKNLEYSVETGSLFKKKDRLVILHETSGEARPGEVVAIVGENGAGKSVLLDSLAGRTVIRSGERLEGQVTANGTEIHSSFWRRHSGYVQQRDIFFNQLRVVEIMKFAADLKLSGNQSEGQKLKIIDEILKELGLMEVRNRSAGAISLCQRKRLSIGVELLTFPKLLFLDEPTGSLDSTTANELMKTLKDLAERKQMSIIITSRHIRLDCINLVSKLVVMTLGQVVYFGEVNKADVYFQRSSGMPKRPECRNRLDTVLDFVHHTRLASLGGDSEAVANQMYRKWRIEEAQLFPWSVDESISIIEGPKLVTPWPLPFWSQFIYNLQRNYRVIFRNTNYIYGQLFLTIGLGLYIAFSGFQPAYNLKGLRDRTDTITFVIGFWLFMIAAPTLFVFQDYKQAMIRERFLRMYQVSPSYIAKLISVMTFRTFFSVLFSLIVYFIAGLRLPFNYFLVFAFTLICYNWYGITLIAFVDAIVLDFGIAQVIAGLLFFAFSIFGGEVLYASDVSWIVQWMKYLSPSYYAFRALMYNEFDGNTYGDLEGSAYLSTIKISDIGVWGSLGILMGYGTFYSILAYFGLRYFTKARTSQRIRAKN